MPPPTTTPLPHTRPLTLIVATTPIRTASSTTPPSNEPSTRLGIGLKGTLPWPRIKADMNFFARVTSRPPAPGTTNAIIMGRKTYDSVPKHLRPLAKRISVVITRDTSGSVREGVLKELEVRRAKLAAKAAETPAAAPGGGEEKKALDAPSQQTSTVQDRGAGVPVTDAIVTPSLDAALAELDSVYGAAGTLGKIFVIGGAEIYGAALRDGSSQLRGRPVRVVMTNVVRKSDEGPKSFECDTFFPLDGLTGEKGWRSASSEEVSEWVGEEVTGEWRREGEVEIQMVGFEKVKS